MKKALLLIAATSTIVLAGCNLKNITKEIIETSFDQSWAQQTGVIENKEINTIENTETTNTGEEKTSEIKATEENTIVTIDWDSIKTETKTVLDQRKEELKTETGTEVNEKDIELIQKILDWMAK